MCCAKSSTGFGCLHRRVDPRAPPHFREGKRRVQQPNIVEIPVDPAVEVMPEIEVAAAADQVRIAHDVDRAAVAQQVIELRAVGELVDAPR